MKGFLQVYAMCLFALGLLAVLCMASPLGMPLLMLWQRPALFWTLAAVLPAVFAWAWTARRRKGPGSEDGFAL